MTTMTLHTLFRSLFHGRKPLARRGQAGRRTALGVEQFEDRTVPAAFVDNVVGSVVAVERDPIGLVGSVAEIDPAFPGAVGSVGLSLPAVEVLYTIGTGDGAKAIDPVEVQTVGSFEWSDGTTGEFSIPTKVGVEPPPPIGPSPDALLANASDGAVSDLVAQVGIGIEKVSVGIKK